jgi:hypothetical protein
MRHVGEPLRTGPGAHDAAYVHPRYNCDLVMCLVLFRDRSD